ncbi:MAG: EVE domain-containing protein [Chloroflexota bacterium]
MPGSHWMITLSPENFDATRKARFTVQGVKNRHRKKAERMAPGDRILFYVNQIQVFPAIATVTSAFFEDQTPIWESAERRPDRFPWRVRIHPDCVLEPHEYIDARLLAPRLLYVKRWAPEDWALAFQGNVHLLSAADFALVDNEIQRLVRARGTRRERMPVRVRGRDSA